MLIILISNLERRILKSENAMKIPRTPPMTDAYEEECEPSLSNENFKRDTQAGIEENSMFNVRKLTKIMVVFGVPEPEDCDWLEVLLLELLWRIWSSWIKAAAIFSKAIGEADAIEVAAKHVHHQPLTDIDEIESLKEVAKNSNH
jgi:hypothetical protein